jgi:hypothetical protein
VCNMLQEYLSLFDSSDRWRSKFCVLYSEPVLLLTIFFSHWMFIIIDDSDIISGLPEIIS